MTKLVRYDRGIAARLDLDQAGIHRAASQLIGALQDVVRADGSQRENLAPLFDYAEAGLRGEISFPRNWNIDPLRYEFRERALPGEVNDAYAIFTFYTHGSLKDVPRYREIGGQLYVEVEE